MLSINCFSSIGNDDDDKQFTVHASLCS